MERRSNTVTDSFKEYSKRLFAFIRGKVRTDEDAEDILQDVWFQLSNTTEIIDQIGAWLYRVARNKIIDRYRKNKPEALEDYIYETGEGEWEFKEILLADPSNPEVEYLKNLFWEQLNEGLSELPEEQRAVFILNELEGQTFAEIAATTGENIKTLISRKGYAVKHLRIKLQTLFEEFLNY
ncbi:RNA polymerase sigma factor [Chitinophagaceae bacterium LB-8]|uniref:RNA polymerase sigma factor n=1 Tax=Paraflavisolibacter caeni TaxID=2982496 RepID=A0A9X2XSM7_9BACT|nr:RNA polymerase sigma factor [Paraflavisolibacter caeni]MCU7547587.1 RNA polymerase sigma factor [Paraflavisolibacter caeni]